MSGAGAGEPVTPWARLTSYQPLARVLGNQTDAATVMRVKLPTDTGSAAMARALVGALLDGRNIDAASRADLVLAVSEASSNAIEYGIGRHLDLCVEVDRDGCLMSVRNAVDEAPTVGMGAMARASAEHDASMPPAAAMRGRGIAIIDSVMDEVAIEIVDQRCVIEMYRRRLGD